ncbi:TPA: hypothetical protein DDZ49_03420 [Candidatus Wolfebacteria bacterium]|uniref:Uncharacterized protein n=2 Tax=Candidatus Wolfeibacteriota TaxID=1752735 RepID=A0A0G4ATC4_9BACT|nr:MAG: hypothetical protein UX70_C0001G0271 [Candidatus Wolfebacteria bacterium GW2011_GWB1_47_1]KKU41088.1 MAG: hypothetical protein UX58_C0011G0029 [Candidatus Wolfebacteria bacterium GW2011_GWB2_46_69]KKU53246.1 MAG: hypothetical protein UX76_C0019G0005 [Candidatus Wolfebacteria bacterium GW2011_GWC1_47_103]KKU59720.1 MAG: hypothetical protein UX83_C0002G0007 [Candidatus Wolfebacteria bacterium GW2011_GWE2_47_12]KKU65711.1 MAG: hypothetical protein UX90_C0002G0087 [Candidatus Wolfebacteria 
MDTLTGRKGRGTKTIVNKKEKGGGMWKAMVCIMALTIMLCGGAGEAQAGKRVRCVAPNEPFLLKAAAQLEKETIRKYPQSRKLEGWKFDKETGEYWASFASFEKGEMQSWSIVIVYAQPTGEVQEITEGEDEVYSVGCWSEKKK